MNSYYKCKLEQKDITNKKHGLSQQAMHKMQSERFYVKNSADGQNKNWPMTLVHIGQNLYELIKPELELAPEE